MEELSQCPEVAEIACERRRGPTAQRQLADALPIPVMIADAAGAVQFFNRRWHELTGQPVDDIADWQQYLHPDDAAETAVRWQAAVRKGERLIAMRYRVFDSATRDYRWHSAQAVAIADAAGAVAQWIGAAVDIDEEMRAQEALVRSFRDEIAGVRNFQRALIPTVLPAMSGLSLDAEYRVGSRAGLIGGDWYDSTLLRDGRLLFSIGDVMGHGMEAAIDMSRVRQSIVTVAATTAQPTEILRRVNDVVNMQDIIATAIVGIVDPARNDMELACAGHPRPVIRAASGALREVEMNGLPLGVADVLRCETASIAAAPGDEFIFYTDGLIEFSRDIEAASNALFKAIRDAGGPLAGRARRLCDAVLGTAAQPDDVAVLVLRVDEASADEGAREV